jgi:hypothetical protein
MGKVTEYKISNFLSDSDSDNAFRIRARQANFLEGDSRAFGRFHFHEKRIAISGGVLKSLYPLSRPGCKMQPLLANVKAENASLNKQVSLGENEQKISVDI